MTRALPTLRVLVITLHSASARMARILLLKSVIVHAIFRMRATATLARLARIHATLRVDASTTKGSSARNRARGPMLIATRTKGASARNRATVVIAAATKERLVITAATVIHLIAWITWEKSRAPMVTTTSVIASNLNKRLGLFNLPQHLSPKMYPVERETQGKFVISRDIVISS